MSENNDLQYSKESELLTKNISDNLTMRFVDVAKLFQKALKNRTKNLRTYEEKKNSLKNGKKISKLSGHQTALFLQDHEVGLEINGNGQGMQQAPLEVLQRRSESIQTIERMLGDIAGLFQRVTNMVQVQESMIERIDKDIDHISDNVIGAKKSLGSIYENIASNRRMIFTVFFMLLIFSALYIIVFL